MAMISFFLATTNLCQMHSWQRGGWVISTMMITMTMTKIATTMRETITDDDDTDDNVTTMVMISFFKATTNLGWMHSWQRGGWVISTMMMMMRIMIMF